MSGERKKVVIVTNIPNPYRIPLFNEVHQQLFDRNIDLHVIFGAATYKRRNYNMDMNACRFSYEILESKKMSMQDAEQTYFAYNGLNKAIRKQQADLIIINGFSLGTIRVYWLSLIRRIPFIIWSGTVASRGGKFSLMRVWQRKWLVRGASGFIAYGKMAADYLKQLGADPVKIAIARNTVDTTFFAEEADRCRQQLVKNAAPFVFIYVGFIIRKKNLETLLSAVKLLAEKRNDFRLKLVGDGVDKAHFEDYVSQNGISEVVSFSGYVQKSDMPAELASADCFVFPSNYDIWGLVVNEAMSAGLPCISSIHSGVTPDLIQDGVNGFAVDFSDQKLLLAQMEWMIDHPKEAEQMGFAARKTIQQLASIPASAKGVVESVEAILS